MPTSRPRSTSVSKVGLTILAAPLAILLVAGGCKEAPTPESAACQGVPSMAMTGRVTDAADVLTAEEEKRLSDRLARYEARTKHQMAVATTASLNGARVDNFGSCLGDRWAIGRKDVNDGVLILIAPKERQMRIATGTGMEKLLPDEKAKVVIGRMTPYFKSADYAGGLTAGVEAIAAQAGDAS